MRDFKHQHSHFLHPLHDYNEYEYVYIYSVNLVVPRASDWIWVSGSTTVTFYCIWNTHPTVFVIFRDETQGAPSQGATGGTKQCIKTASIMGSSCCFPSLSSNISVKVFWLFFFTFLTFLSFWTEFQLTIWIVNSRLLAQVEILLTGQWSESWELNWKFS